MASAVPEQDQPAQASKKRRAPSRSRRSDKASGPEGASSLSEERAIDPSDPSSPGSPARVRVLKPPFTRSPDGAAARRAAQMASDGSDLSPSVKAAHVGGPSLDPQAESSARGTGMWDELRRLEDQLSLRIRGEENRPGQKSFLDQVGALMRPVTYQRWLSQRLMQDRSLVVDDFGLDPIYSQRWRSFFEFLYRQYWRVETSGLENVPDRGRALLVANHSGTLPYDGIMIMCALRYDHAAHRVVRPLVEDFVFHFPFLGVFLNRLGCVRACQENAERLLQQDNPLVVFPEGIKGIGKLYRNRYQLQRFGRGGFIRLAIHTRTPIIPTAVIGAEEIHPMFGQVTWLAKYLGIPYVPLTPTFPWLGPLGAIPLPSKWQIRFGEPIDLAAQYGTAAVEDRILVNRLTEQVRSSIQHMVDEALAVRRSFIFG